MAKNILVPASRNGVPHFVKTGGSDVTYFRGKTSGAAQRNVSRVGAENTVRRITGENPVTPNAAVLQVNNLSGNVFSRGNELAVRGSEQGGIVAGAIGEVHPVSIGRRMGSGPGVPAPGAFSGGTSSHVRIPIFRRP